MEPKPTKTQLQAIKSGHDATLVIAGPGTGKTQIIASRIKHLIQEKNIVPSNILCLTFTDSGATSMKQRISSMIGGVGYEITIGTFHSFSSSLIQEYPDYFNYEYGANMIDEIEKAKIIKQIINKLLKDNSIKNLTTYNDKFFYSRAITSVLSSIKKEGISVENFHAGVKQEQSKFDKIPDSEKLSSRGERAKKGLMKIEYESLQKRIDKNNELGIIYEEYEKILLDQNKYDYEDMIEKAGRGLEKSPELLETIQEKYTVILVDEYQDTNGGQNKILSLLLDRAKNNVFIVGDDDQAIFRFQGANIKNFTDIKNQLKEIKIITLEDNFRSPQLLLDAALCVISNNQERITSQFGIPDKKLVARGKTAKLKSINIKTFDTDTDQDAFIIERLQELNKKKVSWRDCAIIVRSNKEQYKIASSLQSYEIPYLLSAESDLLKDQRIISLFNILNACCDPLNNRDLAMLLMHPATPIKIKNTLSVIQKSNKENESIYNTLQNMAEMDEIKETIGIIDYLVACQEVLSGVNWIQKAIRRTGFLKWSIIQPDSATLIAYLKTIIVEAKKFQDKTAKFHIKDILEHFQDFHDLNLSLKPNLSDLKIQNSVSILTAHRAKGMEFDYVFIPNAIEENWENKRRGANLLTLLDFVPSQTQTAEDERRIFYVAATRAKKELNILTYDLEVEKEKNVIQSKFVAEIDDIIEPKKIEPKNIEKFIEKTAIQPEANRDKNIEMIAREIVTSDNFALSATAINIFLRCPREFLYGRIIRVPTIQIIPFVYGNAIHESLQRYFQNTNPEKRNPETLIRYAKENIEKSSILSKKDNQYILARATQSLTNYFKECLVNEKDPLYTEKDYKLKGIVYEKAKLDGKIDKISLIKGNQVQVVDYKTGTTKKSLNQILGKTKTSKLPDKDAFRQLMFYKLMLSLDKSFEYTPVLFTLDYVDQLKKIDVPLDEAEYEKFKDQIKQIWHSIQNLSFLTSTKEFPFCMQCDYCKITNVQ